MGPRAWRGILLLVALFAGPIRAEPFAYLMYGAQVDALDLATKQIVANLAVGSDPRAVGLPAEGRVAYVANRGDTCGGACPYSTAGYLSVMDTTKQALAGRIDLGIQASDVVFTADGATAFVAGMGGTALCDWTPKMVVVDTATGAVVQRIPTRNVAAMATHPTRPLLFAADRDANLVWVIDTRTRAYVTAIAVGAQPSGIAVSASSGRVVVANSGSGSISVIDPNYNLVVATIPLLGSPAQAVAEPAGSRVFVSNPTMHTVEVVDPVGGSIIAHVQNAAWAGSRMAIAPDGKSLYVLQPAGATAANAVLTVIDTAAYAVTSTVPLAVPYTGFTIGGGLASSAHTPDILSGLWWNSTESGWGMHLSHRGNNVFAAWFTYDDAGAPKWYFASNCGFSLPLPCPTCVQEALCGGDLYEASGPPFFTGAFNSGAVHSTAVGSLQMRFHDKDHASINWTVRGKDRSTDLARQMFGTANASLPVDYTDLWFNPAESGWGMGITQQGNVMFLAWYVYDDAGVATWLFASNCAVKADGNGCNGTLYRASGPAGPTSGLAFDPSKMRTVAVGTIDVTFTDANNASMTYTVDGRSAAKTMTRQIF